jgi:serine/threonine protein kinase
MDAPTSFHPTDQSLRAYGLGKLDESSAEVINTHLESCVACRRRTAEMSSDSFLSKFREGQSTAGSKSGLDRPGSSPSLAGAAAPFPVGTLPPELEDHKDYEVVRELGRGGMGVVYLVRNRLMGRNEVLKVMGRHLVERPEVSERFLREIRAVASLRHPNIVAAHHAFHVDKSIAFTMEFVDGYDLSKMVKSRGPLPVAHACLFIHQAALGLQHAHEEGMVHRDIKPGNLMVARRGEKAVVKVLDFGLAKAAREGTFDSALTHAGQMLGTPDFIAPEQSIDAQKADIRADIYSLGCTLYYLLTGGPPFRATSLYDLLQAHHSMDAKLLNFVRPEVPTELAALVAKMMAKEPERRFQTPAEISQALAPFYKKGVVPSPKPETSQVATTEPQRKARVVKPTPTEPLPAIPTAPAPLKSTEARPEAMWASLIDFREPERPAEVVEPIVESSPPRRWIWPAVAAGVLLFGFAAAWMGGVLNVKTDYGTVILENLPPGVETLVDGNAVTVTPANGGAPLKVTIETGDHKVGVPKGKHTLVVRLGDAVLRSQDVTIESRGQEPIRIRLEETPSPQLSTAGSVAKASEAADAFSGEGTGESKSGSSVRDALQTKTIWVGKQLRMQEGMPQPETGDVKFSVLERGPESFVAILEAVNYIRKIRGQIKDGRISWLKEDVEAIKGNPGHDHMGKLQGNEITLTYSGIAVTDGRPVWGTLQLRLFSSLVVNNRPVSPTARQPVKGSQSVTSKFENGDDEGWDTLNLDDTQYATRAFRVESDGQNSWLTAQDISNNKDFGWHAPNKYCGNHSDKFGRSLAYDIWTNGNGSGGLETDWYVRLRGRGKVLFVDQATVGRLFPNRWSSYSIRLDVSGGWQVFKPSGQNAAATDDDIKEVLSDVTDLWIKGEFANGEDVGRFDNVEFGKEIDIRSF